MDIKQYNLKTNPFRVTPGKNDELIWAGFPLLKGKIINRIKLNANLSNTSLVLNWGEYGSGKTHAARYFSSKQTLDELFPDSPDPISFIIQLPKTKDPIYEIFRNVIDELNIQEIRSLYKSEVSEINSYIENKISSRNTQNVLKIFFNQDVDESILKSYLYGIMTNSQLVKSLGEYEIFRHLGGDNDYIDIISELFSCLTLDKKISPLVILWIDEFEDIAILNSSSIDRVNNFIRELLDKASNNLLVFLNLTQSALITATDLGAYIIPAVVSRIKERNNFELPTEDKLREYFSDLLKNSRISDEENPNFPFTDEVVDKLINDLDYSSIREFNTAFSTLLELSLISNNTPPIDEEFLKANYSEIIWNKGQ